MLCPNVLVTLTDLINFDKNLTVIANSEFIQYIFIGLSRNMRSQKLFVLVHREERSSSISQILANSQF